MKRGLYLSLTAIALSPLLFAAGCGVTASLVSRASAYNEWPKKRILLMPARDLTGIPSGELVDTMSSGLSEVIGKAGSVDVCRQHKIKKPSSFTPGQPIDPELIKEAKEMGINAIVFETVNPIEANPHKIGIWPFRRKAWRFRVSMNVDILDVNRGTILLSKEVAHTITFSDESAKEEQRGSPSTEMKKRALKESLPDIIEQAATAAIHSLNSHVWTGTILSVHNKGILINAGIAAGLRPGTVFEVFREGESITSFQGRIYHLPGPKGGEIRAFSIERHHSWAESIDGTGFKSGQMIRVKK